MTYAQVKEAIRKAAREGGADRATIRKAETQALAAALRGTYRIGS